MRITNEVASALRSIQVDPNCGDLVNRLRYTKTGRLRRILGKNSKTIKGEKGGVLTAVAHLAPARESGANTCVFATSCVDVCIKKTGQLVTSKSQIARISKTLFFKLFQEEFLDQLEEELRQHVWVAKMKGMAPAIRLNGTSDIPWERHGLMEKFSEVQWYDYTKWPLELRSPPENYSLTFSLSEDPDSLRRAKEYLRSGQNAAVVVQSRDGMTRNTAKAAAQDIIGRGELMGFPVVSGDEDDIRFWDPPGHWVILHAKGPATRSQSGFVYRTEA